MTNARMSDPAVHRLGASVSRDCPRGTVYLIVLAAVALATVLGVAGLLAVQSEGRAGVRRSDAAQARAIAVSAVELGLLKATNTSLWRASVPVGGMVATMPFAGGTLTLRAADPTDSNLANSTADPVLLTGTGVYNSAEQLVQVKLTPKATPMGCLSGAVHAEGAVSISIGSSGYVWCDGALGSNTSVSSSSTTVDCDVYAVGTITGSSYVKTKTPNSSRVQAPDSSIFAVYTALGTPINYASLSGGKIQNALLSPGSNPYGSTNASGIYVINCGGNSFEIRDSRIVGTLVVLNAGAGSCVNTSCLLEPIAQDQPSLLVSGSFEFRGGTSALSELAALANFNPPGTPYRGQSNILTTDTFPSLVSGWVYISGNVTVTAPLVIEGGLVVGGTLSITSALTVHHPTVVTPPVGFQAGNGFIVQAGDWAQGVK